MFHYLFDGVKRHFQQYFSYIVAVSFIGGEKRSMHTHLLFDHTVSP
jgi:hypothetical protein